MCLISIAPKGTDKYSEFFINSIKNGARLNNDYHGFGFKRAKTGATYMHKGFFSFDDLLKELHNMKIVEEDELVIHSRTCSAGSITKVNSHPFVLDPNLNRSLEAILGPQVVTYPIMFHNGTFGEFRGTGNMSDTYNFVNNFMRIPDIWDMFSNEPEKFAVNFRTILGSNRLAFISRKGIHTHGTFIKDKGYMFSNGQYNISAPVKGATPRQTAEAKILKLDQQTALESPLTITIKVKDSNFDHFVYRATANIAADGITKGENYIVKKLRADNGQVVMQTWPGASFRWISRDRLDDCFQLIPIGEHKHLYIDYANLHTNINGSQSAIKKQYAALVTHLSRRAHRDTINVKFNKNSMDVKVDALIMFLGDYPNHIPKKNLESIARSLEKSEA